MSLKKTLKTVIKIIKFRKINTNNKRILPSQYSKNENERYLGRVLSGLKTSKHNPKPGRRKFYSELEEVIEKHDDKKLFDKIDKRKVAIEGLITVLEFIKEHNRKPKDRKSNEYKIYKRYQNLNFIKNRKLPGIWYPGFNEIIKSYGFEEYFKSDLENVMIDSNVKDLLNFYKKFKRNPRQLSNDPNERNLYRKLVSLRQVKKNKTCQIWNPEIDEQIKKLKIKNIFV